jgi:hypothetical protein
MSKRKAIPGVEDRVKDGEVQKRQKSDTILEKDAETDGKTSEAAYGCADTQHCKQKTAAKTRKFCECDARTSSKQICKCIGISHGRYRIPAIVDYTAWVHQHTTCNLTAVPAQNPWDEAGWLITTAERKRKQTADGMKWNQICRFNKYILVQFVLSAVHLMDIQRMVFHNLCFNEGVKRKPRRNFLEDLMRCIQTGTYMHQKDFSTFAKYFGTVDFQLWCIDQILTSSKGASLDSILEGLTATKQSLLEKASSDRQWSLMSSQHEYPLFVSSTTITSRVSASEENDPASIGTTKKQNKSQKTIFRTLFKIARFDTCLKLPTVRFQSGRLELPPTDRCVRPFWRRKPLGGTETTVSKGFAFELLHRTGDPTGSNPNPSETILARSPISSLFPEEVQLQPDMTFFGHRSKSRYVGDFNINNGGVCTGSIHVIDLYAISQVEDDGKTLLCSPLTNALEEFKNGARLMDPRKGFLAFKHNNHTYVPWCLGHPLRSMCVEWPRSYPTLLHQMEAVSDETFRRSKAILEDFCTNILKVKALSLELQAFYWPKDYLGEIGGSDRYVIKVDETMALEVANENRALSVSRTIP